MKAIRNLKSSTLRKLEVPIYRAMGDRISALYGFPALLLFLHELSSSQGIGDWARHQISGATYDKYILFENADLLYNQLIPFLRQALLMLPIIVVFSLLSAIMLNQKFWGRTFLRAVFFLPVIFTTGQVVQEFITQGEGNLGFLDRYNITTLIVTYLPPVWANPITKVMDSFVLVLWYSGVQILIFLAGRQTIPPSVYEAARIDGANPWETFWKITLPAMIPFVLLNLIYTTVDLFTFPSNPILTQVNTLEYGRSSALAWIYFVIIFFFLGLVYFLFSRAFRTTKPTER